MPATKRKKKPAKRKTKPKKTHKLDRAAMERIVKAATRRGILKKK